MPASSSRSSLHFTSSGSLVHPVPSSRTPLNRSSRSSLHNCTLRSQHSSLRCPNCRALTSHPSSAAPFSRLLQVRAHRHSSPGSRITASHSRLLSLSLLNPIGITPTRCNNSAICISACSRCRCSRWLGCRGRPCSLNLPNVGNKR